MHISVRLGAGCNVTHYHTLKMGTELAPETSANLNILTRLSAEENFIEFR
jgi:hypothetical protein